MNWNILQNETELNRLVKLSFTKPIIIFKHSTRCSISSVVKHRLDKEIVDAIDFYYLDLIAFRQLSNLVAEKFGVHHESPQVLLIKNGECIYDESHSSISVDEILEQLN